MPTALIQGCGGFIGGHLCNYLKNKGYYVIGVDINFPWLDTLQADELYTHDLRFTAFEPEVEVDEVYQLAASMGGMGFISTHHADILHDNALININSVEMFKNTKARYFYSSSACVYPDFKQDELDAIPLKETDAFPAQPQDAYGLEKLFSEELCRHHRNDYGFNAHVARFHNTYGPYGAWTGGREKAPAALCRKVAEAKLKGVHEIEIWGDGEQQRTFTYVDDTVEGIYRLTQSDFPGPLNIGSTESTTINNMAEVIADIAEWTVTLKHVEGPQGVRSRNSDNTLCKEVLDWEPTITLREGLSKLYPWVEDQVRQTL